jgi:hypothetical protein
MGLFSPGCHLLYDPMNTTEIIHDFREFCRENANPDIVQKYSRYFKGGYDGWGLPPGIFHAKVAEILAMPGIDLSTVLSMAEILIKSPKYEEVSTDFKPFFHFIEPMMHDPEREVHQGLGWLLHEMRKSRFVIRHL